MQITRRKCPRVDETVPFRDCQPSRSQNWTGGFRACVRYPCELHESHRARLRFFFFFLFFLDDSGLVDHMYVYIYIYSLVHICIVHAGAAHTTKCAYPKAATLLLADIPLHRQVDNDVWSHSLARERPSRSRFFFPSFCNTGSNCRTPSACASPSRAYTYVSSGMY